MRRLAFLPLVCLGPYLLSAPLLTAYRTAQPPVIDGVLNDPCWRGAIASSHFLLATGDGFPAEQTVVRLAWSASHLYLGIEASEPLLDPVLNMLHKVKADAAGRDASVFSNDCVELFLQPAGKPYVHFAANSATGTYEGRGMDGSWNCDWQCKTSRAKTSYIIEMAIPFAALGGKPAGEWRWNATRHRPQAKEYSSWSGLRGGFHQPDQFGVLRFAEKGPATGPVSLVQTGQGESLSVQAGAPAELAAEIRAGKAVARQAKSGQGNLVVALAPPPAALAAGSYRLTYRLRQGKTILAESAPIVRILAAGVASLKLNATGAEARFLLNGEPVPLQNNAALLRLAGGLNVLAIEATGTATRPSLRVSVGADGCSLPLRWRTADAVPDNAWQTAMPNAKWPLAPTGRKGFWSKPGAPRCLAVAAIFVEPTSPVLFPKSSRFLVPRGSSQLLRAYLPSAPELLLPDYQLVVEIPTRLAATALDPFGAEGLRMGERETVPAGAGKLRRQYLDLSSFPGRGMELSLRWGDGISTLSYQPALTAGGTRDWTHLQTTVTAPAGAKDVHPLVIKWQNRGYVGTFWVDNIVFRREGSDVNLLKMGTFDEPTWKRKFAKEGPDGSNCYKVVGKPDQTHRQQACWVDEKEFTPVEGGARYVLELDVKCERLGSPEARPFVGMLLKDNGRRQPKEDLPLHTYASVSGGSVLSWPRRGIVRILPELRNVRPKRARIAPCYYGPRFSSPEVEKAYAENCYRSGITWTYGKTANGVVPHLAPRGHKVILSISWHAWSIPAGSRPFAEEHPEVVALGFDGKPERHIACPTYMLSEGDAMLAEVERALLSAVSKGDYAGANWDLEQPVVDPPTFCVCPRCLAAFRAWAKLPPTATVDTKTLLAEHREQWVDFRCMQNAEMAGKLRAMLRKSPHPIEFSLYSGYQSKRTKEHYGVDWARMAPHLDFGIGGYGGGAKSIADTVAALGDVPFMGGEMWYLSDSSDARPTPRYEIWRNRLLRQFAKSGGNGCLIWYLPPMDGGAFYATSEAAELIAKHEAFFSKDQRCDDRVKVEGLSAHDWAAFAKDGRTLIMLLNFAKTAKTVSVTLGDQTTEHKLAPYAADLFVVE